MDRTKNVSAKEFLWIFVWFIWPIPQCTQLNALIFSLLLKTSFEWITEVISSCKEATARRNLIKFSHVKLALHALYSRENISLVKFEKAFWILFTSLLCPSTRDKVPHLFITLLLGRVCPPPSRKWTSLCLSTSNHGNVEEFINLQILKKN